MGKRLLNLSIYSAVFALILLSLSSCRNEKQTVNSVTFNVGFEDTKWHHGLYNNKGKEGVYFFKARFNPHVKFYDLEGNLKDSFSLQPIENEIGPIAKLMFISKDTMIAVSYIKKKMAGIRKDGSFLFKLDLDSLSAIKDENRDLFVGTSSPTPIIIGNNIIFTLIWDGKHRNQYHANSESEYYTYILENRMQTPVVCKVASFYSKNPQITYGLKNYYLNKSPEIKSYGFTEKNCHILNDKIFVTIAIDRNIYELDVNTLDVIDTIPIIPKEFEIPTGIKQMDKIGVSEDDLAEQELKDKCGITNMLYSDAKKQYYVFLKTGKDLSAVDELGYPFVVYVYDRNFKKMKEYPFNTDEYSPKTAMITSRGIMIEKIIKGQQYGKKTFEFIDL